MEKNFKNPRVMTLDALEIQRYILRVGLVLGTVEVGTLQSAARLNMAYQPPRHAVGS